MSTQKQEETLVLKGRAYQLEKLARSRHKTFWEETDLNELLFGLRMEMYELREAADSRENIEEVWRQAANVANFAMMVAARYETLWRAE